MDLGPYLLLASLEGAVLAAVLSLTALGLSLVFGVMRVVNVAHGEFFMLGAVASWFVATFVDETLGAPAWLGFAAALLSFSVWASVRILLRTDSDAPSIFLHL